MDKIVIQLSNGCKLVAERNTGEFNKEVYIGIETPEGSYTQDLAIIRPTYRLENNDVIFDADRFEILVFGDHEREDYTNKFTVKLYKDKE